MAEVCVGLGGSLCFSAAPSICLICLGREQGLKEKSLSLLLESLVSYTDREFVYEAFVQYLQISVSRYPISYMVLSDNEEEKENPHQVEHNMFFFSSLFLIRLRKSLNRVEECTLYLNFVYSTGLYFISFMENLNVPKPNSFW